MDRGLSSRESLFREGLRIVRHPAHDVAFETMEWHEARRRRDRDLLRRERSPWLRRRR